MQFLQASTHRPTHWFVYDKDGLIRETFSLGSPVNTIAGQNVYLVDSTDPNWLDLKNSDALALVDETGTVIQLIAFKDPVTAVEGPANGLSAIQVGEHSGSNKSLVSTDGGNSYDPVEVSDPGVIPCYAPGMEIMTPTGPRRVEVLRAGDEVTTLDLGPMTILWCSARNEPFESGRDDEHPVLISAGSLGIGLPDRDLIVSPQHRILVGGHGQLCNMFSEEAFVPAKALTSLPGVRFMYGKSQMKWYHFALKAHCPVIANGAVSESLLLGPMVLNKLPQRDLRFLLSLFQPQQEGKSLNGPVSRPCLKVKEVQERIRRARAKSQAEV